MLGGGGGNVLALLPMLLSRMVVLKLAMGVSNAMELFLAYKAITCV